MFDSYGGGIHQTAIIGHPAEMRDRKPGDACYPPVLEEGVRVEAYATIDAGTYRPTTIGAGAWIFKHAHIGHDCIIGRDVEISTGAIIGGSCEIGDGARVGLNATVKPFVKIGAGVKVGCGAVVVKDVPAGAVVFGNPARAVVAPERAA